jgi:DNA-binding CsgD family transcriptional regulator
VRHLAGLLAAEAAPDLQPDASNSIGSSAWSSTAAPAGSRVAWATHRSQMYTPGPAISLATSSCERPQNEHGPGPRGRPRRRHHGRGGVVVAGLVEPPTARELEVLQLLAAGAPNRVIAEQLVVTLETVKKHLSHLFDKLGVANRTQAVARARELGRLP